MARAIYKLGEVVIVDHISGVGLNTLAAIVGCKGTIQYVGTNRGIQRRNYCVDGTSRTGAPYSWWVMENEMHRVADDKTTPNYPGNFKKAKVHRVLAADQEHPEEWKPTPQW